MVLYFRRFKLSDLFNQGLSFSLCAKVGSFFCLSNYYDIYDKLQDVTFLLEESELKPERWEAWQRWFISLQSLSQTFYTLGKALQPAYESYLSYKADKIHRLKNLQILTTRRQKKLKKNGNNISNCWPPFVIPFAYLAFL